MVLSGSVSLVINRLKKAKNGMSFPAKPDFFYFNELKRQLEYKSSALSLNVKPNKILQAAKWLSSNSILYREQ